MYKMKLLRCLGTPFMLFRNRDRTADDTQWRRKISPLVQHIVLEPYIPRIPNQFLIPLLKKNNVFFDLKAFETAANLPVETPKKQQFDELRFESPLNDDYVQTLMKFCDGKVGEITFTCDKLERSLSLMTPLLTDRLNFPKVNYFDEEMAASIINLLDQSSTFSVYIKHPVAFIVTERMLHLLNQIIKFPGRVSMDRTLLGAWALGEQLMIFPKLAQTVFIRIDKNTNVKEIQKFKHRFFFVADDYTENEDVVRFLAEPIANKRVVFSYPEFWSDAAPKNKIYPWVPNQEEVTFDIDPSPPSPEEVSAFQQMCPTVKKSNIKDMSHADILRTMVSMTTDELKIGTMCLHTDSPLVVTLVMLQPKVKLSIDIAHFQIREAFTPIPDEVLLEINHIIVHGMPDTQAAYKESLDVLSKFKSKVYQLVDDKTHLDWLVTDRFVVDPLYYNYEPLVAFFRAKGIEPKLFNAKLRGLTP